MNSAFTLHPGAVRSVPATDKDAALTALADCMAHAYDLDAGSIASGFMAREQLGTTGFGRGVAIPHAYHPEVLRPLAAIIRPSTPLDFGAVDGLPVTLLFGLLSPADAGSAHLQALAEISRMTRDDALRRALRDAPCAQAVYALISNRYDHDAA